MSDEKKFGQVMAGQGGDTIDWAKLQEKLNQGLGGQHPAIERRMPYGSDTCPSCGYCQHCGRGGRQYYPYFSWCGSSSTTLR